MLTNQTVKGGLTNQPDSAAHSEMRELVKRNPRSEGDTPVRTKTKETRGAASITSRNGHKRGRQPAQKQPARTRPDWRAELRAEDRADRQLLAKAAPLTLDEFATLTKAPREYIIALLREGVFNAALLTTPDGPRIGLAAFPIYLAVHEIAERTEAGALTLAQADHVLREVLPHVPALWDDAVAGRSNRVAVEFPKTGAAQPNFDLTFVENALARAACATATLLRKRGLRQ
jgi:hypothetical protein